jgi:hypothetical protein
MATAFNVVLWEIPSIIALEAALATHTKSVARAQDAALSYTEVRNICYD